MKALILGLLGLTLLNPDFARADLNLPEPSVLLEKAAKSKEDLRDVINQLDQNLAEIRDGQTFDKYFYLLDELQADYERTGLGKIYPDAVKSLGDRMAQKGVNWMDVIADPTDKILYYHKWMAQPQTAFAFLYGADYEIKQETDLLKLANSNAGKNLEAALNFAGQRWPKENSLLLLYRSTISDLAVRILKAPGLTEQQANYWVQKIYTAEPMTDLMVSLQNAVYAVSWENKGDLHSYLRRLQAIHMRASSREFNAPEALISQIGDTAADVLTRSLRLQEILTDREFDTLLSMMQPRHFAAVASTWGSLDTIPNDDAFAAYYIEKAHDFLEEMKKLDLVTEARAFAEAIGRRAATIVSRFQKVEGFWEFRNSKGQVGHFNIIQATEDVMYAAISPDQGRTYQFFYIAYDVDSQAFLAARLVPNQGIEVTAPILFAFQKDGTIKITNVSVPNMDPVVIAKRTQTYPNLLVKKRANAPAAPGVYRGSLQIADDRTVQVEVSLVTTGVTTLGTMTWGANLTSFNTGNNSKGGVIYVTSGKDEVMGSWLHLRMVADADGKTLRGYAIVAHRGLLPTPFVWKKVRPL